MTLSHDADTALKTVGLSPKVVWPALAQLVGAVANLIASGGFTKVVLGQIVVLVGTTVLGLWAKPGVVTDSPGAPEPAHPEAE